MLSRILSLVLIAAASVASAGQRYDFLWVIDNSSSSVPFGRTQKLIEHLPTFIQNLHGRSFRMAVTTTDYFTQRGDLVSGANGVKVVDSTSDSAAADFASILSTIGDTATSFWEQGLESAFQAIAKHGTDFLEDGVPLVVVYVSDADDYSCADKCYGSEPEHNPAWLEFPTARYASQFIELKEKRGIQVSTFALVGTPDSTCAVESNGYRYTAVQPPGGVGATSSICDDKFVSGYLNIALTLAHQP